MFCVGHWRKWERLRLAAALPFIAVALAPAPVLAEKPLPAAAATYKIGDWDALCWMSDEDAVCTLRQAGAPAALQINIDRRSVLAVLSKCEKGTRKEIRRKKIPISVITRDISAFVRSREKACGYTANYQSMEEVIFLLLRATG